jgi:hypothetical protein
LVEQWWISETVIRCTKVIGLYRRDLVDAEEVVEEFFDILARCSREALDWNYILNAPRDAVLGREWADQLYGSFAVHALEETGQHFDAWAAVAFASALDATVPGSASGTLWAAAAVEELRKTWTGARPEADLLVRMASRVAPAEALALLAEAGRAMEARAQLAGMAVEERWAEAANILESWAAEESPAQGVLHVRHTSLLLRTGANGDIPCGKATAWAAKALAEGETCAVARMAIDASVARRDDLVVAILRELHRAIPEVFAPAPLKGVPMEWDKRYSAGLDWCEDRGHWPHGGIDIVAGEEGDWGWAGVWEFLSGAAWCAGMHQEAYALATREYLGHSANLWPRRRIDGPLLVLALTASSQEEKEMFIHVFEEPEVTETQSPTLFSRAALLRAESSVKDGAQDTALGCVAEAFLWASDPTASAGWHGGLPLFGAEVIDGRMRPDTAELHRAAATVGATPKIDSPAGRVQAALEASRSALGQRTPGVAIALLAQALEETAKQPSAEARSALERSAPLFNWDALDPHPALHHNKRLDHVRDRLSNAAEACQSAFEGETGAAELRESLRRFKAACWGSRWSA